MRLRLSTPRRKRAAGGVAVVLAAAGIVAGSAPAHVVQARPGLPCTTPGSVARSKGVDLLCTKVAGKLRWLPRSPHASGQHASGPHVGGRCPRLRARVHTSAGDLVCTRHGRALVWEPVSATGAGSSGGGSSGGTSSGGTSSGGTGSGGGQTITWQNDPTTGVWTPSATPPACPAQPMLSAPVDLSQVTSVLYPGQVRGNSPNPPAGAPPPGFKPHGGFVFGNAHDNTATVNAALEAYVTDAARYLVDGEVQYLFDVLDPCGILVRYGHLLTLTPTFQAVADRLPPPTEGDSRTTEVAPGSVPVSKGEAIATRVGVSVLLHNTFLDFGVFDLRSANAANAAAGFYELPDNKPSLGGHGVCWLRDWFPASDEATLNALPPGDAFAGRSSYYC